MFFSHVGKEPSRLGKSLTKSTSEAPLQLECG